MCQLQQQRPKFSIHLYFMLNPRAGPDGEAAGCAWMSLTLLLVRWRLVGASNSWAALFSSEGWCEMPLVKDEDGLLVVQCLSDLLKKSREAGAGRGAGCVLSAAFSCLLPASLSILLLMSEPTVLVCDLVWQKGDVLWMGKSSKAGAGGKGNSED